MNFPVSLNIGPDHWFNTYLRVKQTADDVYFEYGDSEEEPILSDRVSSFNEIDIFETEKPKLFLYGAASREILFNDSIAISNIWLYLQKLYKFSPLPGTGLSSRRQKISKIMSEDTIPNIPSTTFKSRSYAKIDPLNGISPEDTPYQFTGSSSVSFITLRLQKVEKDDIPKVLDEENHLQPGNLLSSLDITDSGYCEIYRRCLIPKDVQASVEKYKQFRKRWTLLTTDQWKYDKNLRKYVTELEFSIELSTIKSQYLRKILADVLLSFAEILIQTIFVGAPSIETIYDRNGDIFDFETACSTIFWAINQFSQKFIDNVETSPLIPTVSDLYTAVHDQLASTIPNVRNFLDSKNITDFSFLSDSLSLFFMNGRSLHDCQLIIVSLLISKNHRFFLSLFTAAIFAELEMMDNSRGFKPINEFFTDSEFPNINLRVLLFNVDNLAVLLDLNKKKQIQVNA